MPLAPSFDVVGFFARDAATLEKVGDVLLPQDQDRRPLARNQFLDEAFADCPPAEAARFAAAVTALAPELPMREVALDASFWPQALALFRNFQAYEAWRSHGAWIERERPRFGPGISERFAYAATVTAAQKQEAEAFRDEAAREDRRAIWRGRRPRLADDALLLAEPRRERRDARREALSDVPALPLGELFRPAASEPAARFRPAARLVAHRETRNGSGASGAGAEARAACFLVIATRARRNRSETSGLQARPRAIRRPRERLRPPRRQDGNRDRPQSLRARAKSPSPAP